MRNNGDGTFTDVTMEAGMLSYHPTQAAVWADFNLDGWLDLFIGNESTMGTTDRPCEFYISNGKDPQTGKVSFRNVIREAGLEQLRGMAKGVTAGDVNNDGWPDLYLSFFDRPNVLLLHQGSVQNGVVNFKDITAITRTAEPLNSFPCWFWDYNNDGWEDLLVASYFLQEYSAADAMVRYYQGLSFKGLPKLYKNLGNGKFEDVTQQAGLTEPMFGMGSSFGDLDNDGFLDFYMGTGAPAFSALVPNKLYLNQNGKRFADVTTPSGTGHLQKGHAVGFGDIDNDGDEDIFAVLGGAFEGDVFSKSLFLNPEGNKKPHITLVLQGVTANRNAIGARVLVHLPGPDGKLRSIARTVNQGSSFGGNSLQLEIGLGDASRIEYIEVVWPDAQRSSQKFYNPPLNKKLKIVQGAAEPEVL